MDNLPLELYTLFGNYLCYVDFQSLRSTCKYIWLVPQKKIRDLIIDKLKNHIEKPEKLLDLIGSSESCISGSFILAILYGKDFYNDIDIYEKPRDLGKKNNIYGHSASIIRSDKKSKFSVREYLYKNVGYSGHVTSYGNITRTIRNYGIFQHITIVINLPKLIMDSYDMKLCSNMYYKDKLYIKSWNVLFSRTDVIKPDRLSGLTRKDVRIKSETRMKKYIEKGFYITKHKNYNNMLNYIAAPDKFSEDYDFYEPAGTRTLERFNTGELDTKVLENLGRSDGKKYWQKNINNDY